MNLLNFNRSIERIRSILTRGTDNLRKPLKIIILGLDAAGKTTILSKLTSSLEANPNFPTLGFNVVSFRYKKAKLTIWDVGGQDRVRENWYHYFANAVGLIFVVDSSDTIRLNEAKLELGNLLDTPELKQAILLIFANKQDVSNCLTTTELARKFGLKYVKRKWYIQKTCGIEGYGVFEGFDWLYEEIMKL